MRKRESWLKVISKCYSPANSFFVLSTAIFYRRQLQKARHDGPDSEDGQADLEPEYQRAHDGSGDQRADPRVQHLGRVGLDAAGHPGVHQVRQRVPRRIDDQQDHRQHGRLLGDGEGQRDPHEGKGRTGEVELAQPGGWLQLRLDGVGHGGDG